MLVPSLLVREIRGPERPRTSLAASTRKPSNPQLGNSSRDPASASDREPVVELSRGNLYVVRTAVIRHDDPSIRDALTVDVDP